MRKYILPALLFISITAYAQDKYLPSLKQGAKLNYVVFSQGQEIPIILSLDSIHSDFVKMRWTIDGMGTGVWLMNKKSLDAATRGWWDQPAAGIDQQLSDDQLVVLLSRAQWRSIQNDNSATLDNVVYAVRPASDKQQLKISGKMVDAILLESANGSSRVWILNNPSFPLLLKIEGNTAGPDLELRELQ